MGVGHIGREGAGSTWHTSPPLSRKNRLPRWDRRGEEGPRKAAKVSAVPDVTHVPAELGGVAHVHEVERNVDGGVETIEE